MRLPSFPTIVRTFYAFSNTTWRQVTNRQRAISPFVRPTTLRSMPTIPFLASFFGSSNKSDMSFPDQRSDEEWKAVLNKGLSAPPTPHHLSHHLTDNAKSNSVSSVRRVRKHHLLGSMTSTSPPRASTNAPAATPLCTRRLINFRLDVDGLHTSIRYRAPSPATRIAALAWRGPK